MFIVTVPADWKPQRPWDVPPRFESGELHTKNLPMYQASGFCRVFNKRQLQENMPQRKWAIVSKHLKARNAGEHPDARAKRKGVPR